MSCIWEDRGILLMIIEYIIDNYDVLKTKNLIINEKTMNKILQSLFTNLNFSVREILENDFYFNIRNIIKNQDIIINYKKNYITGKNIKYVPWSKRDNLMIFYEYDNIKNIILPFENKELWDVNREREILDKYEKFNPDLNYKLLFNYLNTFFKNKFEMKGGHLIPLAIPISIDTNKPVNCDVPLENKNLTDKIKLLESQEEKYKEIIKVLYRYIKSINKITK
jgi:hypothetical protein